ncbi:EAL domain-containing protein [Aestuariicella sp. G3-2]|uniref:putative bifunctional diguanylate cyclase/phosphodiesterase n=1 Tax=Pseudomaricurvus albidus TaxID=2842452 RepID=UPI001C0DDA17|nr:GGDEF domain-containing response regulator [Aestuariicella albida]MBU3068677.1 EAL domain-containing protein [Aestuariicella albida]
MDILIIDDDAVDRMSATRTLKASMLQIKNIDQTASASEGIALAKQHQYDMILLDYQLPPSNGIEVLRELRSNSDFATAIVMLSHSNDEELALSCIEAGAQDFIMKSEMTAARLKRAILISKERYQLERKIIDSHKQLKALAEKDSLTGLSNRYFFDEALKDAIPKAARDNTTLALLFLDLDKFKNINDTLGHKAGDDFLKEVARRLEKPVREGDKLCRLGGDEFAILVHDFSHPDQIRFLVKRILESLSEPAALGDQKIDISVSIGVATYPECGQTPVELMQSADIAMYRAKASGRNQVQYYSKDFHNHIENRVRLEIDLKQCLEKNQFVLFYQPQINSQTLKLEGVEALIRWQHPELGLIAPDDFISVAEEAGLINDIGRWVLESACQQFSQWMHLGMAQNLALSISVNLSAKQLTDFGLTDHLQNFMARYNIPAHQLELELTESCVVNSSSALDMLKALSELGIQLALDDFGTGYSSISHLNQYPFKVLKIDQSFIQPVKSLSDANLLKAIIAFAHSLNYETVAEGIETELQRDICIQLGVSRLQGFLFSEPLPAHELEKNWLTN